MRPAAVHPTSVIYVLWGQECVTHSVEDIFGTTAYITFFDTIRSVYGTCGADGVDQVRGVPEDVNERLARALDAGDDAEAAALLLPSVDEIGAPKNRVVAI